MDPKEIEELIAKWIGGFLSKWGVPQVIVDVVVQVIFDYILSNLQPQKSMSAADVADAMPKALPIWLVPIIVQTAQALLQWVLAHNKATAAAPTFAAMAP